MATDNTEFRYLTAQADALGVAVPQVTRQSLILADGRTLSALRYGDSSPQVAFLHGAGLNAHTWDRTVLALGVPSLAIDLAGHGDSSWRDDAAYAPRALADDVVQALRAWTDTPQLLIGQSLGGLTAAAVASAAPALVSGVVVVDITPGIGGAGPSQLRAFYADATDFASRDEVVEHAMSFGLGGEREDVERGVFLNTRVRPDGRVEWKHHFARLAAAPPAQGETAARPDLGGWDDLEAITSPLTLVRGMHGFVDEQASAEFSRRLPQAQVTGLPTGHNVQETAPVELARIIRDLLRATVDAA